eukprot:TRINITY_DN8835_c0_g1_i6.p1 TRINITY_DN8835_c0_g1~~TRINITY_DN8835_c0_g1_i6.p1  ORF type:complete len:638 (-),score=177.32 TRINITY_DN8835_c0_g1_i6:31-1944(-)
MAVPVVVETEEIGKQLLANGRLQRRVTIIPLNKIASNSISAATLEKAQNLVGENNVHSALSLVGYDEQLEAAMRYVFGGTLVCKDSNTAKRVTFDRSVRSRSVTLEGDLFDPNGTVSGGSQNQASAMLLKLHRLQVLQQELAQLQQRQSELRAMLDGMSSKEATARQVTENLEFAKHELSLLETRLDSSQFARLQQECQQLEADVERITLESKKAFESAQEAATLCKQLEKSIKDFEKERHGKTKETEKALAKAKKDSVQRERAVKEKQQELERVSLEHNSLVEELQNLQQQIASSRKQLTELQSKAQDLHVVVTQRKEAYEAGSQELEAEKARLTQCDKQMSTLKKKVDALTKDLNTHTLEIKKLEHKMQRFHGEQKERKQRLTNFEGKYDWIPSEKHLFGQPHTDYDFAATEPRKAQAVLAKLTEEQNQLSKKINKKVMAMFEKAEQEYQELLKKRNIIENDKAKIEAVICELDRKKNEAIRSTWQRVNRDFGSIFSTVLPGTNAKLAPVDPDDVLQGLEVRVAFGEVWKESLTELSGGQRSLLALSLILALLLFKPAPMYILDEIDAALDLSHTQNIGAMLKNHFSQSQFIVVSLKEGMFNNANVVFRTKFVDGVSAVTRTVPNRAALEEKDDS